MSLLLTHSLVTPQSALVILRPRRSKTRIHSLVLVVVLEVLRITQVELFVAQHHVARL